MINKSKKTNYMKQLSPENKKIAIYAGVALGLGAVTFFVYEFFKKPKMIDLGQTKIQLGNSEESDEEQSNTGSTNNIFTQYAQSNPKTDLDLKFKNINEFFGLPRTV